MNKWPLEVGRIAISRAGRDAGRKMLVVQELDADFVCVADVGIAKWHAQRKSGAAI